MNRQEFEGKWNQIKGKVKEKWGKLTDNDVTEMNGKYDQLHGKLQERYGYSKEQSENEIKNWTLNSASDRGYNDTASKAGAARNETQARDKDMHKCSDGGCDVSKKFSQDAGAGSSNKGEGTRGKDARKGHDTDYGDKHKRKAG